MPDRWPYSVPPDLRRRLEEALSARNCGPAEVWGEVVDWLNANGVPLPAGVQLDEPPPNGPARYAGGG